MATNERDEASFQDFLTQQIAEKDAEIKRLNAQIDQLKREKGISSAREGLTFQETLGTSADKDGKHFCTKCLDQDKRNQLKDEPSGYRCMVCAAYYRKPDGRTPKVIRGRGGGGGPQGWMA